MINFSIYLIGLFLIFSVLLLSQQLLFFKCGLFFLGGAIFFSFGAYCSAMFNIYLKFSPLLSFLLSIIFTTLLSIVIGYPLLKKLKQDYFALVTLAISLFFSVLYRSFAPGGNSGMAGIEPIISFNNSFLSQIIYLIIISLFVFVSFFAISFINKTRIGLLFEASKIDESTTQALGFSTLKIRLQAFTISGLLGGAAGAMQAHYVGAVDPGLCSLSQTILVLSGTILSGKKSIYGCFIGAFFVIIVPEIIQKIVSLQFGTSWQIFPGIQIIYGLLIIIISFRVFRQKQSFLRIEIGNT
jgi:branched-chain amino acid transport system permease protein